MYNENDSIDDNKLKSLHTEGGFGVPVGYFQNMRKQVLEQTTGYREENNFVVPEGYFEHSRETILAQTIGKKPAMHRWSNHAAVKYSAAAVVLLSSMLAFVVYKQQHQRPLASMSNDDIILYFEEDGVRDIPVSEVSFVVNETPANSEEKYLMNHADEQSIIEEL
jgi:hypothetical protein